MKRFRAIIPLLSLSTAASGGSAPELPSPNGCTTAVEAPVRKPPQAMARPFPPPQLEIRVPSGASPVASGGRTFLFYELHLQNHSDAPMALLGLDVLDAEDESIARLDARQLAARLVTVGVERLDNGALGAGQAAIVFVCMEFRRDARVPASVRHRLTLTTDTALGGLMPVVGSRLPVLSPPVRGGEWTAADGPSLESHHRTGVFVSDGLAQISRRYAIDWKIISDGVSFVGNALDVRAYRAYGRSVLAVADGTVVFAKDGLPDNVPRTSAGFAPAVAISAETVAGNTVVLRLSGGQYAHYAHLLPGSVRVRQGERVKRGAELGRIGNSGDAREPHLHFQLSSSENILAGEGLPYLIDAYRAKADGGEWTSRQREFPLGPVVVDFGERR